MRMVLRAINVCVNHTYLFICSEWNICERICLCRKYVPTCQLQMICVSVMRRASARESVCDTRELVSKWDENEKRERQKCIFWKKKKKKNKCAHTPTSGQRSAPSVDRKVARRNRKTNYVSEIKFSTTKIINAWTHMVVGLASDCSRSSRQQYARCHLIPSHRATIGRRIADRQRNTV